MNGKYSTAVYDKRDDLNFKIVNFPYLSSKIPSGPAYGVCISQLVRIGSDYFDFTSRGSIRKHVENGICVPAMDKFLNRHVSHR